MEGDRERYGRGSKRRDCFWNEMLKVKYKAMHMTLVKKMRVKKSLCA